jgi:hypothetical protein
LNSHEVEYLVIGGYAVNYHGYPRATGDIDIWMGGDPDNAARMAQAVKEFGFPEATPALFAEPGKVIRMGLPPLRIEVLTSITGVEFETCYSNRVIAECEGAPVSLIGLDDLKRNKKATGRLKDLADLEQLG